MKFTVASALILSTLSLLTAANILPRTITPAMPASQCNTDDLQCCLSAQESDALTPPLRSLLELLGIDIGSLTGKVGATCGPLHIIAPGFSDCTAQPLCCNNHSFSGLIALGVTQDTPTGHRGLE
ncbi:fungal hydrophobin-domain-containing protein [Collybia nuda]|uniref:Hydrophobin n=1 Tax=Collybia nuda TaxID=64659 RepID=A0A9P5Y4P2_9AGAR|nr:fungal hydrophobin-domain-containing protein [Collybia nuda]